LFNGKNKLDLKIEGLRNVRGEKPPDAF